MSRPKLAKTKKKETDKAKPPVLLPPVVDKLLDLVAQILRRRRDKKSDPVDTPQ